MVTRTTSTAAFQSSRKTAVSIKERALTCIKGAKNGLTCDEIAEILDLPITSVRPSVTNLYNEGLVDDSSDRRPTASGKPAIVWFA